MKKIIIGLAAIFIVIQFIRPFNNHAVEVSNDHIERQYDVPANIRVILSRSCYDCHSDNTNYPWYSKIQPVAWYLENHIKKGKEELNFSRFGEYSKRKQRSKLRSMVEQVKRDKMPLPSYTLIHQNAALPVDQKKVLIDWFEKMADNIK